MENKMKNELRWYLYAIDIYIHHSCHSKSLICYSQKEIIKLKILLTNISEFIDESDFTTEYDVRKSEHYLSQLQRILKISNKRISDNCFVSDEYAPKNFQIIRRYGERYKLIGKAKPPSKGMNRDRAEFKKNDKKLPNSISRTRQSVYELMICNDWDYFATFRIDTNRYDGLDLDSFMKKFRKWINNYSRYTSGKKIEYLLVHELGNYGKTWHIHGVMKGIPMEHLSPFIRGKHPIKLVNSPYLNWKKYEHTFGYCSLEYGIRSKKGVAKYMTKRLRKSVKTGKRGLHKPLYYCSNNLERSEVVASGYDLIEDVEFDCENDFTGIKWFDEEDDVWIGDYEDDDDNDDF